MKRMKKIMTVAGLLLLCNFSNVALATPQTHSCWAVTNFSNGPIEVDVAVSPGDPRVIQPGKDYILPSEYNEECMDNHNWCYAIINPQGDYQHVTTVNFPLGSRIVYVDYPNQYYVDTNANVICTDWPK